METTANTQLDPNPNPSGADARAMAVPVGADQRVIDGRRARLVADGDRRDAGVARIAREHATRRTALLGADNEARLRAYVATHRTGGPATNERDSEERRAASMVFARDLGIDIAALQRLDAEFSDRIAAVVERPTSSPESSAAVAEPAPTSAVYTSWGSWDTGSQVKFWGCTGKKVVSQSYLNPAISQTGGHNALKVIDPGDIAGTWSWRENGFLVDYTPPASGRLIVTAYLQCVIDDHFISTWDEWGWSSFKGQTREFGVVETYSNWDDYSADDEFHTTFVHGLSTKAIDGGSGIVQMAPQGQARAWAAVSGKTVAGGVPMLIYVATAQRAHATCNDVETFIGVNSAWRVNKIVINTFAG